MTHFGAYELLMSLKTWQQESALGKQISELLAQLEFKYF